MRFGSNQRFSHHFQYHKSDCTIITDVQAKIKVAMDRFHQDLSNLEKFVEEHPDWKDSYFPVSISSSNSQNSENSNKSRDAIISLMEDAAKLTNVGPMATVAGALADRMVQVIFTEIAGETLPRVAVVENGGEISINSQEDIIINLQVLSTSLQSKLGFKFIGGSPPLGIATSSATFGHADSLGEADAVVVFAPSAAIADGGATYICNAVKGENNQAAIQAGLTAFKDIPDLYGVFIVKNEIIAQKGEIPPIVRITDSKKKGCRK
ncbi:MAG: hypothetical protein DRO88_05485 [Promethearchaeia archaeon]|nr:MAG: hypothetical protein DRO88_05485 [Candidatus Lokiarchaeia archaeon]